MKSHLEILGLYIDGDRDQKLIFTIAIKNHM